MYILCYQLLTRFASTESPLVSACRYFYKLYIELRHLVNLFYTFPRKLSRNGTSAQVFDEISMFKNKKTSVHFITFLISVEIIRIFFFLSITLKKIGEEEYF